MATDGLLVKLDGASFAPFAPTTGSTPTAVAVPQTNAAVLFAVATPCRSCIVQAASANGANVVWIGYSNTAIGTHGIELTGGQAFEFTVGDASLLWSVSSAAGQKLNVVLT